jgi:sec-independent protein translocase protein TatA
MRDASLIPGALMPFQLGIPEVILVLVIALVFLGPKRLPEAGNAIGRGIREFRDGISGGGDESPPAQPEYEPPTAYVPPPAYVPPAESTDAYRPPAAYSAPVPAKARPRRHTGRSRAASAPAPDGDPVTQLEPAPVAPVDDPEDVGGGDALGERPGDQAG